MRYDLFTRVPAEKFPGGIGANLGKFMGDKYLFLILRGNFVFVLFSFFLQRKCHKRMFFNGHINNTYFSKFGGNVAKGVRYYQEFHFY